MWVKIRNIKTFYKDKISYLKIIIIIRNPVEAAFSNYTM